MIALVLAAGLGTRLRPYSAHTPKPLFTLNRQPLLDIMIQRLMADGVRTVIVNTHHHHRQIEDFLQRQSYAARVMTRYEPVILGTGGAIRNTADIWRGEPLLVVNSDIDTDIDFKALYRFFTDRGRPVTLALCDDPAFNTVAVDASGHVTGFRGASGTGADSAARGLTFTGIQVLDEAVLPYLPADGFASSIDAYQAMLADGHHIAAYVPHPLQWSDLGTPERYLARARELMASQALTQVGTAPNAAAAQWQHLPGDGSDRQWHRLRAGKTTLIVAEHGIKPTARTCEAEAFVAIGRHLQRQKIPVPQIFLEDAFAGLVFLEDLGCTNFQTHVQAAPHLSAIENDYRQLIDILVAMSFKGAQGFDPLWTYQTRRYDREVVLQNECQYFVDAFLNGYLGLNVAYETLAPECRQLAEWIIAVRPVGFMHRDFQSRNIMVRDARFYLIDFQGGRIGPPHYDLASLLIDPYVDLPSTLRESLLTYFTAQLTQRTGIRPAELEEGYRHCALARNLQILGAYGFLTHRKGKRQFAPYIPAAVRSLQQNLARHDPNAFPMLARLAYEIIPTHLSQR
ncbi:MAG: phosphotransferase [Desulfobacterales bacterium]|jgi:aminoglycoside/choline kinase family phosphotransferase/GTP:adenosylcobinamide-phosphate guanylyltransferase